MKCLNGQSFIDKFKFLILSYRYSYCSYQEVILCQNSSVGFLFSVLNLEDKVGRFAVGQEFDALRINPVVPDSPLNIFNKDTLQDVIQKFFYLGKVISGLSDTVLGYN